MEFQEYLEKLQNVQQALLDFVDGDDNTEDDFINIVNLFESEQITNDPHKFNQILRLLAKISNHHYRSLNFHEKLDKILLFFKEDIKKNFSNSEIFKILKNNKRRVLLLIKHEIINVD